MKWPGHHINAIRNQKVIPVWNSHRCALSHVNTPLEASSYKTSSKSRVTSGEKSYFAATEEQIFAVKEPRGRISWTSNPFLPRNIGLNFRTDGLIHHAIPLYLFIRPTSLTLVQIFFWILPMAARLERLISIKTKGIKLNFDPHYETGLYFPLGKGYLLLILGPLPRGFGLDGFCLWQKTTPPGSTHGEA